MEQAQNLRLDVVAARSAIAAIRALDLRTASMEEIGELLTPIFRGYSVRAPRFVPGVRLFRCRLCEKPTNIRELSYPPADTVRLGRANRPGNPVLYCCTSREAPFFESRPTVGTTVAIVRWITTAPMLVNHAGYTHETFDALGSNRHRAGWGQEPAEIPSGEGNQEIAEFLADVFTQPVAQGDEHLYKLTAVVADKLLAADFIDGLLYPTVAMRANADNFALKPSFADSNLRFLKAEFARIDAVRKFAYDIKVLDTATTLDDDGTIRWKGRLDNWVLRNQGDQLTFQVENGEWVAYDADGNIVEPE